MSCDATEHVNKLVLKWVRTHSQRAGSKGNVLGKRYKGRGGGGGGGGGGGSGRDNDEDEDEDGGDERGAGGDEGGEGARSLFGEGVYGWATRMLMHHFGLSTQVEEEWMAGQEERLRREHLSHDQRQARDINRKRLEGQRRKRHRACQSVPGLIMSAIKKYYKPGHRSSLPKRVNDLADGCPEEVDLFCKMTESDLRDAGFEVVEARAMRKRIGRWKTPPSARADDDTSDSEDIPEESSSDEGDDVLN